MSPQNQIQTGKLQRLGMMFDGQDLLRTTIGQLVEVVSLNDRHLRSNSLEEIVDRFASRAATGIRRMIRRSTVRGMLPPAVKSPRML